MKKRVVQKNIKFRRPDLEEWLFLSLDIMKVVDWGAIKNATSKCKKDKKLEELLRGTLFWYYLNKWMMANEVVIYLKLHQQAVQFLSDYDLSWYCCIWRMLLSVVAFLMFCCFVLVVCVCAVYAHMEQINRNKNSYNVDLILLSLSLMYA